MSEKRRIRIESNGRADRGGDTRVFIDGKDVSETVSHVTWSVGAARDHLMSKATITFIGVELAVDYVAEERKAPAAQSVTVLPPECFDELAADEAPEEPNERVRAASRRLPEVVRTDEEPTA